MASQLTLGGGSEDTVWNDIRATLRINAYSPRWKMPHVTSHPTVRLKGKRLTCPWPLHQGKQ